MNLNKLHILVILLTINIFGRNVQASEIDSFTNRFKKLDNALPAINQQSQIFFDESLKDANKSKIKCSENKLYRELRKRFKNHYVGKLTDFILESDKVNRRKTPLANTIYQNIGTNSLVLGILGIISDTSGAVINANGELIGSDKFEHFFSRGYAYFTMYYKKKKSIEQVLNYGHKIETGYLGAFTTGVYSYGDLAANFNGMRFWNHLLQQNDDILGPKYNLGPYVTCENKKWVQVKKIDWGDYIDASFDEGQNCSAFKSKIFLDIIQDNLLLMSTSENYKDHGLNCPVNPDKITILKNKYGPIISPYIINDEGFRIIN